MAGPGASGAWRSLPSPVRPPAGGQAVQGARRQLAAAVVVGGLLLWAGHVSLALVAATAMVLAGQLGVVAPRPAAAVARFVDAVGVRTAQVLGLLLLAPIVLVFTFVRAASAVLRHDMLAPQGARGWAETSRRALPARVYAVEPHRPPVGGAAGRSVPTVAAVAALLVLLDLGVGWALVGDVAPPTSVRSGGLEPDVPPLAGLPWAEDHIADLAALEYEYWPFVLSRMQDHEGPTVTVREGARVTPEVSGLPSDAPEVWLLGGATTFGEGQRDEHTIAAELARAADRGGRPVRVVNLAVSGDVLWQQWQRVEQRLAAGGRPDVVLFYGGGNDLAAQVEAPHIDPTIRNREATEEVIRQEPPASVVSWWFRTSASVRLARSLAGEVLGRPAAAGEPPSGVGGDPVDNALAVYRRGMAMAELASQGSGTELVFAWQAVRSSADPDDGYVQAARRLAPDVVDLTALLASAPETFIDDLRTDERGAAVVAEALWPLVEARLHEA